MTLKVACVSVSAALGGSERVLLDFASRADRHDLKLVVLLPVEGPLRGALEAAGIRTSIAAADPELLQLSQRRPVSLTTPAVLWGGLQRWSRRIAAAGAELLGDRPGVWYTNGFKAHLACGLLRGSRRVWHLHEFPPGLLALPWQILAAAIPDAAIANSAAVAEAWRLPLGGRAPRLVRNGVDLERFRPAQPTRWIHRQLELPAEARLIGMPAVFARWKGQPEVVEAFEHVAPRRPDAHLVIVGGPIYDTVAERGYAEELVRRVGRSPYAKRIHFLRFQDEPWRAYPEFDLVIHFSLRPEPFGRVVAEAMACGVPVLAARAGGPLELIEHGRTGWLTPPGNITALAAALETVLSADTAALRAAARRAMESLCSADRFAAEVAAVLRAPA